jgi:membrane-bound metal-dependent hydrolase YbcI (DUF457 family)
MPFTFAHSAAALPFKRLPLVPSALVIGTFAPDFEYYLRLAPDHGFGHTLLGTFVLTLPVALLVLWILHSLVKRPATMLMPDEIRNRLASHLGDFHFGGITRFLIILASLLLGIATHLLWDSFTHTNTWFYAHWPLLRASLNLPVLGPTPYYKVFQHGSTVVGTGVVAAWLVLWYRSGEPSPRVPGESLSPRQRLAIVAMMASVALVGTILRVAVGTSLPVTFKKIIGEAIEPAIALIWWQLVAYGFIKRSLYRAGRSSHTV